MAAVSLTKVWLHDAVNNASYVALYWSEETEDYGVVGEVRRYAGGRLRAVLRPGTRQTPRFEFPLVTEAELGSLRTRAGVLQMLRDSRGRKLWGVVTELQISERPVGADKSVSFTFQQVTYDEAV